MILDPSFALDVTARISAFGALIVTFEMIVARREFGERGVFNLASIMSLYQYQGYSLSLADKLTMPILGISLIGYIILILQGPLTIIGGYAVLVCFLCRNFIRWRRLIGGDGAEQLTTLTLAAILLAVFPEPSPQRIDLAVIFIGGQLLLSYLTSGVAKLFSPVWSREDVLQRIMNTETYGQSWVWSILHRFPRIATMLSRFVVFFQCSFFFFLIGPPWMGFIALAIGLGFHFSIAISMGLNNFLWAFPATYPCVIVLGAWISPFW